MSDLHFCVAARQARSPPKNFTGELTAANARPVSNGRSQANLSPSRRRRGDGRGPTARRGRGSHIRGPRTACRSHQGLIDVAGCPPAIRDPGRQSRTPTRSRVEAARRTQLLAARDPRIAIAGEFRLAMAPAPQSVEHDHHRRSAAGRVGSGAARFRWSWLRHRRSVRNPASAGVVASSRLRPGLARGLFPPHHPDHVGPMTAQWTTTP